MIRSRSLPAVAALAVLAGCGGSSTKTVTTTVTTTATTATTASTPTSTGATDPTTTPSSTPTTPTPTVTPGSTVTPKGASYAYRVPTGMRLLTPPTPVKDSYGFRYKTILGFTVQDQIEIAEDPAGFSYDRLGDSFFRGKLIDTLRSSLLGSNSTVSAGAFGRRRGERSVLFTVAAKPALRPVTGARLVYYYYGHQQLLVTCQWTSAGRTRVQRACDGITRSLSLKRGPSAKNAA